MLKLGFRRLFWILFFVLLCWHPLPSEGAESNAISNLKQALIRNYAVILHAEYEDSLAGAHNFKGVSPQYCCGR